MVKEDGMYEALWLYTGNVCQAIGNVYIEVVNVLGALIGR